MGWPAPRSVAKENALRISAMRVGWFWTSEAVLA